MKEQKKVFTFSPEVLPMSGAKSVTYVLTAPLEPETWNPKPETSEPAPEDCACGLEWYYAIWNEHPVLKMLTEELQAEADARLDDELIREPDGRTLSEMRSGL